MNRPTAAFLSGAMALTALPALAASPKIDQAAVVKDVTACRKITDGPQRLACFDAAVAKMDEAQAKMMKVMPILFAVLFAFFPSGLVLYWVINGATSLAQQWFITRQVDRADHKAKTA